MEGVSLGGTPQKRGKKMILCDTNVIFDYYHKNENMLLELDELGFERLSISSISVAEMYHYMFTKEKRKTKELLNKFLVRPLTPEISNLFEQLMYEHHTKHPSIPDCLIAATALNINAELFTLNKKHFTYYKGIKFYRPKYKHKRL